MRTLATVETMSRETVETKREPGARRAYSAHAARTGNVSTLTYSGTGTADNYGKIQRERELLFAAEVTQ